MQGLDRHRGAREHFVLHGLQGEGQGGGAQRRSRVGHQLAHPELLGPFVGGVVICGVPAKSLRLAQQGPALRAVTGAAKPLAVDEALDRQDRMAVSTLPVRAQPREVEREDARGEIRAIDPR